jgi:hypothetical protein
MEASEGNLVFHYEIPVVLPQFYLTFETRSERELNVKVIGKHHSELMCVFRGDRYVCNESSCHG